MIMNQIISYYLGLMDDSANDEHAYLQQVRQDSLCKDLEGHVVEVSLEFFMKSVLPPLAFEKVEAIEDTITRHGIDDGHRCKDIDPVTESGGDIFAALLTLFSAIVNATALTLGLHANNAKWEVQTHHQYLITSENTLHGPYGPHGWNMPLNPSGVGSRSRRLQNLTTGAREIVPLCVSDIVWLYECKAVNETDASTEILQVSDNPVSGT